MRRSGPLRHLPALLLIPGMFLAALPGTHAALPATMEGQALPSLAPVLERVTPAVVNISTEGRIRVRENPLLSDPFFRRFFNLPDEPQQRERRTQSLGSGVVVDARRGFVITNNHVIARADTITVTLRDGRRLQAELVGSDPETDIAVLKIPTENLTALDMADSEHLRVGDFVVAIGNPFGLGQTVTSGIVSALGRSGLGIEGYEDFIQTDASINPGNSGGALINLRGELVGINTAIFAPNGGNIGIGFAIPSNMARSIMMQLVEYGTIQRGRLGAQAQDLTPELARAFNIEGAPRGAVVAHVIPQSAAARAGLRVGDIITAVNGKPTENADDLRTAIGLLRIGDRVKLTVQREGRDLTLHAVVDEPQVSRLPGKRLHARLEGLLLGNIPESSPLHGRIEGVLVLEVKNGSPAASTGLQRGDVITSVNRRKVRSPDEVLAAARTVKSKILLNIRRGGNALFLLVQ